MLKNQGCDFCNLSNSELMVDGFCQVALYVNKGKMSQSFRKHMNKSFCMLEWLHVIPSYLLSQLLGTAQPSARWSPELFWSENKRRFDHLQFSPLPCPVCPKSHFPSPIIQQGTCGDASQAGGIIHLRLMLCSALFSLERRFRLVVVKSAFIR